MSRSIHTTYKDVKGLTNKELDKQFNDINSDLVKLGEKRFIKKSVIKQRKQKSQDTLIAISQNNSFIN